MKFFFHSVKKNDELFISIPKLILFFIIKIVFWHCQAYFWGCESKAAKNGTISFLFLYFKGLAKQQ